MSERADLREIVERLESLDAQNRELNEQRKDLLTEAKARNLIPTAVKAFVAWRRDPGKAEAKSAELERYIAMLGSGSLPQNNAPAANSGRLRGHPGKQSPNARAPAPAIPIEPAVQPHQPASLARDGETWPVESTYTPGPSLEADVSTDSGGPAEDNGAAGPSIPKTAGSVSVPSTAGSGPSVPALGPSPNPAAPVGEPVDTVALAPTGSTGSRLIIADNLTIPTFLLRG